MTIVNTRHFALAAYAPPFLALSLSLPAPAYGPLRVFFRANITLHDESGIKLSGSIRELSRSRGALARVEKRHVALSTTSGVSAGLPTGQEKRL